MDILAITGVFLEHHYTKSDIGTTIDFMKAMYSHIIISGTGADCKITGFHTLDEMKGSDVYAKAIQENEILQSNRQV